MHFNWNYNYNHKNLYACMLAKFASNGVSNVDKTVILFNRAGIRNKWSSRISAVLDITIEDDERVPHMCASSAQRCHHWRRPLKVVRHSGSWP